VNQNDRSPDSSLRKLILNKAYVHAQRFGYYDREGDVELSKNQLIYAIRKGIVNEQDISNALMQGLKFSLKELLVKDSN